MAHEDRVKADRNIAEAAICVYAECGLDIMKKKSNLSASGLK